jgi:hypothetical protein
MPLSMSIGSQSPTQKKFRLPQYQSSSSQVNQANSDVMQGMESSPSGDLYSGAKAGVSKVVTGLDKQKVLDQTGGADVSFDTPSSNPYGQEAETTPTPPRTGLTNSQQTLSEARNTILNASQLKNVPDLETLRSATEKERQAEQEYANYDPTKQPVSTGRKIAGIASGVLTGVLGRGGIQGGLQAYHNITRLPAMEHQAQLEKEAKAATTAQQSAQKQAEAARNFTQTGVEAGRGLQDVADTQRKGEEYGDTGRAKEQALTSEALAKASETPSNIALNEAHTAEALKPTVTSAPPENILTRQTYDPVKKAWVPETIKGTGGGVQKLSEEDEPVVRGAALAAGYYPNEVMQKYRDGDANMSKFVSDTIASYKKSLNPALAFGEPSQSTILYGPDGVTPDGALVFDPRSKKYTRKSLDEMGLKDSDLVKRASDITGTDRTAYKNANLTLKAIPDVLNEIEAAKKELGPGSGRWNDFWTGKVGTKNPAFAGLLSDLDNLNLYAVGTHTGRFSNPIIEEFKKSLGNVSQDPENFIAKVKALEKSAKFVKGTIEDENPKTAQVLAQKVSEAGSKVKMKAPDGTTSNVDAKDVEHYKSLGAEVVK